MPQAPDAASRMILRLTTELAGGNTLLQGTSTYAVASEWKEGCLGPRFECTVYHGRKAWWQRHEVAGHIASAVRNLRAKDAGTQLTFLYLVSPGHQIMGGC